MKNKLIKFQDTEDEISAQCSETKSRLTSFVYLYASKDSIFNIDTPKFDSRMSKLNAIILVGTLKSRSVVCIDLVG